MKQKCINYRLVLYLLPMIFLLFVGLSTIFIEPLNFVFYVFLIIFPIVCISGFLWAEPLYYEMHEDGICIGYTMRKKSYFWNDFKYITLQYDCHSFRIITVKEYRLIFREDTKERVVIVKTKKAEKLLKEYSGLRIEEV